MLQYKLPNTWIIKLSDRIYSSYTRATVTLDTVRTCVSTRTRLKQNFFPLHIVVQLHFSKDHILETFFPAPLPVELLVLWDKWQAYRRHSAGPISLCHTDQVWITGLHYRWGGSSCSGFLRHIRKTAAALRLHVCLKWFKLPRSNSNTDKTLRHI